jgi:acyl-coenzyme A thioesterase PaaI-like protein
VDTEPTADASQPGVNQPAIVDPAMINAIVADAFPGSLARCVAVSSASATVRLVPEPQMLRPGGFISGPTQFSAADAALWFLVFGALGRVELMALTSELSIRYLRPGIGA